MPDSDPPSCPALSLPHQMLVAKWKTMSTAERASFEAESLAEKEKYERECREKGIDPEKRGRREGPAPPKGGDRASFDGRLGTYDELTSPLSTAAAAAASAVAAGAFGAAAAGGGVGGGGGGGGGGHRGGSGPAALAIAAVDAAKRAGAAASAGRARAPVLRLSEPSGQRKPEPQGVLPLSDFSEGGRVLSIWAAAQGLGSCIGISRFEMEDLVPALASPASQFPPKEVDSPLLSELHVRLLRKRFTETKKQSLNTGARANNTLHK